MSGEVDTKRPFPSLILLGIVDFCCILIGFEQISLNKIGGGIIWISAGVGSGLIGYYWRQIKQRIGDWLIAGGRKLQTKYEIAIEHPKEPSAIHFVFVNIVSVTVDEKTLARGKTFKIRYVINSSEDVTDSMVFPDKLWLGASFRDVWDRRQDQHIVLIKGEHEYQRELTIPARALMGKHMLHANLWLGVLGNGSESTLLARGTPVEILVV